MDTEPAKAKPCKAVEKQRKTKVIVVLSNSVKIFAYGLAIINKNEKIVISDKSG